MSIKKQAKGLGDTIEQITEATGIKIVVEALEEVFNFDCGCEKRKEKLNKLFPYKVECLTEDEYNYLKNFNFNAHSLTPDIQRRLLIMYNRVFHKNQMPTTCGSCWVRILDELKKVYEQHND